MQFSHSHSALFGISMDFHFDFSIFTAIFDFTHFSTENLIDNSIFESQIHFDFLNFSLFLDFLFSG